MTHEGARRLTWDRLAGLLVVVALHGAGLYALWEYQIQISLQEAVTLFVNFINPPPPVKQPEPPKPKPLPKPVRPEPPPPEPPQIVVEAPVETPEEPVAPPPPEPAGPVMLASELAVTCPKRSPPEYPPASRKMGEQGRVVLWVELDEQGRMSAARVETSSGSKRLDGAALAAVKNWRCNPAMRNGMAVRAAALQPFVFKLEGR
jgi:protein TonB